MLDPVQELLPYKDRFFIGGSWVAPLSKDTIPVINPATEETLTTLPFGNAADVDAAVAAASTAFPDFARWTKRNRLDLIRRIGMIHAAHADWMAALLIAELGSPADLARDAHVAVVDAHVADFLAALAALEEEEPFDAFSVVRREPVGVCGLITPWNWPPNQIALKVLPALAAGCTMVLKPSEVTPLNAVLFARILELAGTPPGVFNLVQGDGPTTGAALTAHPDVAMISFTGSTRAGIEISRAAAPGIKRVALELGGKSANILFDGVDLEATVARGVTACFENTGQSCDAPTRMLVERPLYRRAVDIARETCAAQKVGDPTQAGDHLGPLVSAVQFDRVQELIRSGIDEGAHLVIGGVGRPTDLDRGYFVRPTVFSDVHADMRIAREEVFGPVLVMMPFDTEAQAIEMANDTEYGLAAYVETPDPVQGARVARALRAGIVRINGAPIPDGAPFGGYKMSGIGREGGRAGIAEFQELKTIAANPA